MTLEIYVSTLNTFVIFNPLPCFNLVPQVLSSAVTFKKINEHYSSIFSFDLNFKCSEYLGPTSLKLVGILSCFSS